MKATPKCDMCHCDMRVEYEYTYRARRRTMIVLVCNNLCCNSMFIRWRYE